MHMDLTESHKKKVRFLYYMSNFIVLKCVDLSRIAFVLYEWSTFKMGGDEGHSIVFLYCVSLGKRR